MAAPEAEAAAEEVTQTSSAVNSFIPKLTDFGLAKLPHGQGEETKSGAVMGTPAYMAPEQAESRLKEICARTDVYGLGAILYEMLTGRPAFRGKTDLETLRQVSAEEPIPPSRLWPAVPRELETICLKCLEKEPQRRYRSAAALAEDLERWLAGKPIQARPPSRAGRLWRWCRRRPLVAGLMATAAVLGAGMVVALAVGMVVIGRAREETERQRDEARDQRALALARQVEARRLLYASDITLAHRAWGSGEVERLRTLLARHQPGPGEEDLRGFEWYYLQRLIQESLCPQRSLPGHTGEVYAVAFSPDGQLVATACQDRTVKLWDAATGQELGSLRGHTDEVNEVAFSPDGRTLATASDDGTAKLWDRESRQVRATLTGHRGQVVSVAFSPDGRTLATGGDDKLVKLWDPATGQERVTFPGHSGRIELLVFAPDGQTLAVVVAETHGLTLWGLNGPVARSPLGEYRAGISCVAYAHHGRMLATGYTDGSIRLWDAATGRDLATLPGHSDGVQCLAFSPDDASLASGGEDAAMRLWDVRTGTLQNILKGHTDRVWGVAFSPDGKSLATVSRDRTVKLWGLLQRQDHKLLQTSGGCVSFIAFPADGHTLATHSPYGPVQLWGTATGQLLATLSRQMTGTDISWPGPMAFSPDGKALATGYLDGAVRVWDLPQPQKRFALQGHKASVTAVAFSPDGTLLASVSRDGNMRLWEAATGRPHAILAQDATNIGCLAFSADGKMLAAGSGDWGVRSWETATWQSRRGFTERLQKTRCMAFSPDLKILATGTIDRTVKLWDATSEKEQAILLGHKLEVSLVAFSADGKTLATGSPDGKVKLWNVATGQELFTWEVNKLSALAFSPDGGVFAYAGESPDGKGEVDLWFAAADEDLSAQR